MNQKVLLDGRFSKEEDLIIWLRKSADDYTPDREVILKAAEALEKSAGIGQLEISAWQDILRERGRQQYDLGYDHEHDDGHDSDELSEAAACLIYFGVSHPRDNPPSAWPWDAEHWKPKTYRENLVRAGALILAEIERIDRRAE